MSKRRKIIMIKNMNKFWNEQREEIGAGVFAVAMALTVVTLRYVCFFL